MFALVHVIDGVNEKVELSENKDELKEKVESIVGETLIWSNYGYKEGAISDHGYNSYEIFQVA